MNKRRKAGLGAAFGLLVAATFVLTRGPDPPSPNPPGTFSFAALGDAPYFPWEELQYRLVQHSLDSHDLSWVLHLGDIFWRPCTDALYLNTLEWFNNVRHPVIYTPGDNEWLDCWEPGSGGFPPQERLGRLRQIFFDSPARSLGGNRLPLVSQAGSDSFPEFVENARWTHQGIVFATIHLVGSMNGLVPFPARTEADDLAARRRTQAATAWMRETFAEATELNRSAVVFGFHGNPFFDEPVDDSYRDAFEPFLGVLEEETARFDGPVLLLHGDDHEYTVDHPLVRRSTGRRLENLTRLQVPGSPDVGWVRVIVTPEAEDPFVFEEHLIPRWKYW